VDAELLDKSFPSPLKHQLKVKVFASFFIFYSTVFQKMDHLIYHSPVRFFLKAGMSQITVSWVWPSSQLAAVVRRYIGSPPEPLA
jgi:hypothetical protein